jgi:hypothetical protein
MIDWYDSSEIVGLRAAHPTLDGARKMASAAAPKRGRHDERL